MRCRRCATEVSSPWRRGPRDARPRCASATPAPASRRPCWPGSSSRSWRPRPHDPQDPRGRRRARDAQESRDDTSPGAVPGDRDGLGGGGRRPPQGRRVRSRHRGSDDGTAQRPRSPGARAAVSRDLPRDHHDGLRHAGEPLGGGRAGRRRLSGKAAPGTAPARLGASAHHVGRAVASPSRLLVVDDEAGMRKSLAIMLRREGYAVAEAASGKDALDQLGREVFDLVVADLSMDDLSGLDVLRHVKQTSPDVEVILMTGYGTIESAVEAMKLGAFDFITKPFHSEEILLRVHNALDKRRLRQEVHRLRAEVQTTSGPDRIVGVSEPMRRLLASLPRVGQTESTVLITGESGTGKELVARALHATSRRAQGPFVSLSCAALPEPLLENELFGHVKGAFTGALAARKGLLEEAQGGTFFLDEIGEAPLAIQTKLLRVLEERSIRRLGDNRSWPVDIRVV